METKSESNSLKIVSNGIKRHYGSPFLLCVLSMVSDSHSGRGAEICKLCPDEISEKCLTCREKIYDWQ